MGCRHMHPIQKVAIGYLIALGLVSWGYAISTYKVWPQSFIMEINNFIKGDPEASKTTVTEKALNDADIHPIRHIVEYSNNNNRNYDELHIPGLKDRRQNAVYYVNDKASIGYLAIYGTFDFKKGRHGVILLDRNYKVINTWIVHERNLAWDMGATEALKFPHGFHILPDGSIIFSYDEAVSLQRFSWCGKRIWAGHYNMGHSITPDGNGNIWAVGWPDYFCQFEIDTGNLQQTLKIPQLMQANPLIDIFGIRQNDTSNGWSWNDNGGGRFHPNDIEPLLPEMAKAFPQFSTGDLLISLRSINLVFVADYHNYKIKWWRMGAWSRQHDPDWQPDGTITVFDNNMHRKTSRITRIDPKDYSTDILYDGKKDNFYSSIRGKHQLLKNGNILITSPQQGRVIEVTPKQEIAFELLNIYNSEKDQMLLVSEAVYLPENYFEFIDPPNCCD